MHNILRTLNNNPVIAAVRSRDRLLKAICSPVDIIFILKSTIFEVEKSIDMAKKHNKFCAVHFDFIDGLGGNGNAVDYLFQRCGADGIISTRSQPIKYAVSRGYCGVQRFFLIDSMSVDTAISVIEATKPTIVEIMPGIMHNVTEVFCNRVKTPVIAGGMINNLEDVHMALKKGAHGISTSNENLWDGLKHRL